MSAWCGLLLSGFRRRPCEGAVAARGRCGIEGVEHVLARRHLRPEDAVLEAGARYGTTSCVVADVVRNSGRVVAVEPDDEVWTSLLENRHHHRCARPTAPVALRRAPAGRPRAPPAPRGSGNFWLLRGVISDRAPLAVRRGEYASHTQFDRAAPLPPPAGPEGESANKTFFSLEEVQSATRLRLTALLIDCEGCIESMFSDAEPAALCVSLAAIRLILVEGDRPAGVPGSDCKTDCVNYTEWQQRFESVGFVTVEIVSETHFSWIQHYVFARQGPPNADTGEYVNCSLLFAAPAGMGSSAAAPGAAAPDVVSITAPQLCARDDGDLEDLYAKTLLPEARPPCRQLAQEQELGSEAPESCC